MYNLRLLKLFSGCAFLVLSPTAFSSTQKMSLDYQFTSTATPNPLGGQQGTLQTFGQHRETLKYEAYGVASHFDLSAGLSMSQPNYKQISVLPEPSGKTVLLSDLTGQKTEYEANGKLTYTRGESKTHVNAHGTLSSSPYAQQGLELGYMHGFFDKATQVGAVFGYLHQTQPLHFFSDPVTFDLRSLPQEVDVPYAKLIYEQIITERWKAAFELSTSRRVEERPQNIGLAFKTAYALTETLFAQLWLTQITESTRQIPKDNHGYLSLRSVETTLIYEPIYDLLLSLSYTFMVEQESDARRDYRKLTGSDQFALRAKYAFKKFEVRVDGAYRLTNDRIHEFSTGGGLTWLL